ncbi:AP2 domain-containing protein [Bacillus sp. AFS075034]|uniref:AP2 domain-containing protein n=1 Tax=Bacillus sp. AFS075034 TaxID=2034281 RepID=UPI000BFA4195|nr:AP2 domain-containing protein [Bacillus sp. AFS075034]PFW65272.1 HNH endonuclease [Bacillus sp. AFS075034]
MPKKIDITGEKFNSLTVLRVTDKRRFGAILWECKCDCGNKISAIHYHLKIGKIKSCGCTRDKNRNAAAMEFLRNDMIDGTRKTMLSSKIYKNNKSGHKGVCWVKGKQKWRASIHIKGKTIHLGYFAEKEDAIKAREIAEEKYFKPILESDNNENE